MRCISATIAAVLLLASQAALASPPGWEPLRLVCEVRVPPGIPVRQEIPWVSSAYVSGLGAGTVSVSRVIVEGEDEEQWAVLLNGSVTTGPVATLEELIGGVVVQDDSELRFVGFEYGCWESVERLKWWLAIGVGGGLAFHSIVYICHYFYRWFQDSVSDAWWAPR